MKNVYFKLVLCTVVGAILALTSHIYISQWANPLIAKMTEGIQAPSGNYPSYIMIAAYGTAFITVGLVVFVYYQAGHLLKISNSIIKVLVLTVIMLELKGEFLRQPLMDYLVNVSLEGMKQPFTFVFLHHSDKWVANLLLAFCLVYLCPTKHEGEGTTG